jgi:hypothetical protein
MPLTIFETIFIIICIMSLQRGVEGSRLGCGQTPLFIKGLPATVIYFDIGYLIFFAPFFLRWHKINLTHNT